MYRHILVTSDRTVFSNPARRRAGELARRLSARLTAPHLVPDVHLDPSTGDDLSEDARTLKQTWTTESGPDVARLSTLLKETGYEIQIVRA